MQFELEIIDTHNEAFLQEMLYIAIYVPEDEKPLPVSIIYEPSIFTYIDTWGRKGDFGIIGIIDGIRAGAIWIRFFDCRNKGYGFISNDIPELSMAIKNEYRSQGIGSRMLQQFFIMCRERGVQKISISVDKRNRAFRFYIRNGFTVFNENKEDFIMKIEL